MNTYTIDEIERIYSSCQTFDEVEAVSKDFHFLLCNKLQEPSDALQEIALLALRKFI